MVAATMQKNVLPNTLLSPHHQHAPWIVLVRELRVCRPLKLPVHSGKMSHNTPSGAVSAPKAPNTITCRSQRWLSLAVNLALVVVLAALAALFITGGYQLEIGPWQIRSHRLSPLLRLLLPLLLLRLWLSLGWQNLLLLLGSCGFALLLGEGLVRWVDPPLSNPNLVQIHRPSTAFDWELIPGSGGVGTLGEHIHINAAGFRDRDYPQEKPPGTFRIAVMGDSFTFGMGVELTDTYHQQLATLLSEDIGEDTRENIEVLSFGVIGYQIWQHLALLQQRVLDYQPDVVILALFLDDLEKTYAPHHDPDWQPHNPFAQLLPPQPSPSQLWTLLDNLRRRLEHRYRHRRGADYLQGIEARKQSVNAFYRQVQSGQLAPQVYQQFGDSLEQFVAQVRAAGAAPLLAYIPDASQLHEAQRQDINRRIATIAAALETPYVDFTPSFEAAEDPRSLYLFPLDAHTSPQGHALMAQELEAALRQADLLRAAGS